MKRRFFILLLATLALTSCNTNDSSSEQSKSSSSFNSLLSSIESDYSSNENSSDQYTDQYGVTYINETSLKIAQCFDKTRINLKEALINEDFFSTIINQKMNVVNDLTGTLLINNIDDNTTTNTIDYEKIITTTNVDCVEMNYDVKAAKKEVENKPNSLKDLIDAIKNNQDTSSYNNDDKTQAYILMDTMNDGYSLDNYQTHEKSMNSHNMIYYHNPEFYYDLSNLESFNLPGDFNGKGKINNFNFNRYFASTILSYRDKALTLLSYDDVSEWPNEYKEQTYIDEIIFLYQYIVSDAISDEEAIDAFYNLQEPIKKYFGIDIGLTPENKYDYIPVMQFIKICADQLLLFENNNQELSIEIDFDGLINFLIGLTNSFIINPDSFGIDEAKLNDIKSLNEKLLQLDATAYKFKLSLFIDGNQIIKGLNLLMNTINTEANKIISNFTDDVSQINYEEVFKGVEKYNIDAQVSFSFSNDPINITSPDDLSSF